MSAAHTSPLALAAGRVSCGNRRWQGRAVGAILVILGVRLAFRER